MAKRPPKPEVHAGAIWARDEYLDGKPINAGFIAVLLVCGDEVTIQSCNPNGSLFGPVRKAQLKRFGRRGGYRLHRNQ